MAKNVINEKKFKIIALSPDECKSVGFGIYDVDCIVPYELICDNCNELLNHENEVYFVPVLNRVFCNQCLKDWYDDAVKYLEDVRYETRKYNDFLHLLEHKGVSLGEVNYKDI